jgi:rare lipoprotein A
VPALSATASPASSSASGPANTTVASGQAQAPAEPPSGSQAAPANLPSTVAGRAVAGFWVQLGVYRQREGAEGFQRRVVADLDWLAPLLGVFSESATYRLQAGPYASRDEAQGVARRVREQLHLVPLVVERR